MNEDQKVKTSLITVPQPSQPMKPAIRESFDIYDMIDEEGVLLVGDSK